MKAKKTSNANVKRVDGTKRGGACPSTRTIVFSVPIARQETRIEKTSFIT
jgi:hypothetical protein